MSLYNTLMEDWSKEELVKALIESTKKVIKLKDKVDELQHEVFWLRVGERE